MQAYYVLYYSRVAIPPALPQNLTLIHFLNYTKICSLITQEAFYNHLLATSNIKVFIYSINYSQILLPAKYTFLIYVGFIYSRHRLFGKIMAIILTKEQLNFNLVF